MLQLGLTSFADYDVLVTDYRLFPNEDMRTMFAQAAAMTPAGAFRLNAEAVAIYADMFAKSGAEHLQGVAERMDVSKPLVAVAKQIEDFLTEEEIEAVIQHELGHIANGDLQKKFEGILDDVEAEIAADAYAANLVSKKTMHDALIKLIDYLVIANSNLFPMNEEEYRSDILNDSGFKRRLLALS